MEKHYHDPEWTQDDRGYALAWQSIEDGKCPCGCGHPVAESTDPANENAYDGHSIRCFAGKAREDALSSVDDKSGVLGYAVLDQNHSAKQS